PRDDDADSFAVHDNTEASLFKRGNCFLCRKYFLNPPARLMHHSPLRSGIRGGSVMTASQMVGRATWSHRLQGPLSADPSAQVFHTLLWCLTFWWGAWAAILLPFHWTDRFWSMQNEIVTLAALVSALILLGRGRFRAASLTYLIGIWFFATHIMILNGGIHSPVQVLYVTLPISAAWLLGYRAAVWTSAACMACALVFAIAELGGLRIPHYIPGTPLGAWAVLGMACLIGAVPVAQILRDLRSTLSRSRLAEAQSRRTTERLQEEIDEHKRTAQALKKSEERFRLAIEATNDAIWDADLEAGTVTWNEKYSKLYGRPCETSNSWQWWIDHIHPEDRERAVSGLRAAITSGQSTWTCEYRFRRVDDSWAFIYDRAYIALSARGDAWRVIGAMQDLSDRKQAEVALRESEERFRRVFEEGPLGIALVGRDYRFLKVNSALCRMLDYREEELVQKSFPDITHPDDLRAD